MISFGILAGDVTSTAADFLPGHGGQHHGGRR